MDPLTILGLVKGGLGAAKGFGQIGYGIAQAISNKRPAEISYEIPNEIKQMLAIAKARETNPFAEGELIRSQIGAQMGSAIQATRDLGGGSGASLGAIASLYGKNLQTLNQVAIRESEMKRAAEKDTVAALSMMADFQDKKWDMNVKRPYEMALQEFFANRSAATQNIFGGINAVSGAAGSMMQNEELMDNMSSWFPSSKS